MTKFTRGKAPGAHAGAISPDTVAIRPTTGMTAAQEKLARKLARAKLPMADIAATLGVTIEQAEIAAATARTRNPAPKRVTGNLTLAGGAFLKKEAHPGEPQWQAADRAFEELDTYRRLYGPLPASGGTPPAALPPAAP